MHSWAFIFALMIAIVVSCKPANKQVSTPSYLLKNRTTPQVYHQVAATNITSLSTSITSNNPVSTSSDLDTTTDASNSTVDTGSETIATAIQTDTNSQTITDTETQIVR